MASIQSKRTRTGGKCYYVVVAFGAKRKWIRAGDHNAAKILKRQLEMLEQSKRLQKLGLTAERKRIDDFFREYAANMKIRTSANTSKRYLGVINMFLVFLRMFHPNIKDISQIKSEHLESYQLQRLQSIELKKAADGEKPGNHATKHLPLPQTVNYELTVLRSAFIWAHQKQLIANVPTKHVKSLRVARRKERRILSQEECKRLLKTAENMAKSDKSLEVYHNALTFILNTGLRSGELCNLTWSDIDVGNGVIKIQPKDNWSPKTYSREFFLNDTCLKLLKALKSREGYVFKSLTGHQLNSDGLRHMLFAVSRTAGIKDFSRIHDLRHTFNSLMQMNGVDPGTMAKILGHRDLETTMIYTHQTQDHLKKSINRLNLK